MVGPTVLKRPQHKGYASTVVVLVLVLVLVLVVLVAIVVVVVVVVYRLVIEHDPTLVYLGLGSRQKSSESRAKGGRPDRVMWRSKNMPAQHHTIREMIERRRS